MVILIGGESHSGKTILAQKLMEKNNITYLSLDHLKMGLFKGVTNCGFTPLDKDEKISEKIWGIIKGIIDVCLENKQDIIIEGVYLPINKMAKLIDKEIIIYYIILSENYIRKNFYKIIEYENVIEHRKQNEKIIKKNLIIDNLKLKENCLRYNLPYYEIISDYEKEIQNVFKYINDKINKQIKN